MQTGFASLFLLTQFLCSCVLYGPLSLSTRSISFFLKYAWKVWWWEFPSVACIWHDFISLGLEMSFSGFTILVESSFFKTTLNIISMFSSFCYRWWWKINCHSECSFFVGNLVSPLAEVKTLTFSVITPRNFLSHLGFWTLPVKYQIFLMLDLQIIFVSN